MQERRINPKFPPLIVLLSSPRAAEDLSKMIQFPIDVGLLGARTAGLIAEVGATDRWTLGVRVEGSRSMMGGGVGMSSSSKQQGMRMRGSSSSREEERSRLHWPLE